MKYRIKIETKGEKQWFMPQVQEHWLRQWFNIYKSFGNYTKSYEVAQWVNTEKEAEIIIKKYKEQLVEDLPGVITYKEVI